MYIQVCTCQKRFKTVSVACEKLLYLATCELVYKLQLLAKSIGLRNVSGKKPTLPGEKNIQLFFIPESSLTMIQHSCVYMTMLDNYPSI